MNNIINETFTKHLGLLQQNLKLRLSEGKMKDLAIDLEDMSDDEFKLKHGKSKSEIKSMLATNEAMANDNSLDQFTLTHLEKIESRIKYLNKLIYNHNTAVLPIEVKQRLKTDLKNLLDGMIVMINKSMKEDVDDDDDGYDSRRDARHSRDGYVHTGPRQKTNFQKMFPSSSSTVKKLYFYNVPSGKNSEATNMGLRQTKSGKWYSPKPNDIATKEFGSPKEWSPKN